MIDPFLCNCGDTRLLKEDVLLIVELVELTEEDLDLFAGTAESVGNKCPDTCMRGLVSLVSFKEPSLDDSKSLVILSIPPTFCCQLENFRLE